MSEQNSFSFAASNISTISMENTKLPRIEKLSGFSKVVRFFYVLGDLVVEHLLFAVCSTMVWIISFSKSTIQENRFLVSLMYSVGGDIGLNLFITSLTSIILSIRLHLGIRLDSLCDYLAIIVGPQPKVCISKPSRFWTLLAIILMNYVAEQAVNYGVPSLPSLIPRDYHQAQNFTLAPLGGGVLLSGDPSRKNGDPMFTYYATGLSILATDPNADNTEFYTQDNDLLMIYHLPHELFQDHRQNMMTKEFNTLGYIGRLRKEQPSVLPFCASTSSLTSQNDCDEPMTYGCSRYSYGVRTLNYTRTTNILYHVSSVNVHEEMFGRNWTYSIELARSLISVKCQKSSGKASCKARSTGIIIEGKDWLNATAHEQDISRNMAPCFANLLSFNTRSKQIDMTKLAGRLITAMLVRYAGDNTSTGGLATFQIQNRNLSYEISDAIPTYRGPLWLRILLCSITILAALSSIGLMLTKVPVPSTIVSIASSLGEVISRHRAACGSERDKTWNGFREVYNDQLRVYGGVAAGNDRVLMSGEGIKLTQGAGPNQLGRNGSWKGNDDLAHFSISTADKVVPFSLIDENERSSLVFGHAPLSSEHEEVKKLK